MKPIYLDFNATTPVAPEVLAEMLPWFDARFWNAASSHWGGRQAELAVESAREQVAELVGARPGNLTFTSGATESNNLAITGAFRAAPPGRSRVLVGATEHSAVLDVAAALALEGATVDLLNVDRSGRIDTDALEERLNESVAVVSVMLANNETGVIAPIGQLCETTHRYGAIFHTDVTQAVGKIDVNLRDLEVDLASVSAHKMYGPKGVGGLYVASDTTLQPLIHGGGHERGRRSGTLNVPGIIGFGRAAELVKGSLVEEPERQRVLTDWLVDAIARSVTDTHLIAADAERLPNTAYFRFAGADAEAVMANAPNLMISSGSACSSMTPAPSHVLTAMGFSPDEADQCLRFSLGRTTTHEQLEVAVEEVVQAVDRVREFAR